jgi:hypothetical protein
MALFHLLHSKRSGEVTHEAADLIIGVDNISSERAFSNAGFKELGVSRVTT